MSKHLATVARKNSPSMGRNLRQNRAVGGRPSALTGWVDRERERETDTVTMIIIRLKKG